MKTKFSRHAKRKFKTHIKAGWKFSRKDVELAIKEPYFSEVLEDRGVKSALKEWDGDHDLRVIYKEEGGIITVITFYPTEKGRYLK